MAAFNFPNSPSNNQIHTENGVSWKWNSTLTVWKRYDEYGTGIVKQVQFINGPSSQVATASNDGWKTIVSLSITTTSNNSRVRIETTGKPAVASYNDSTFEIGIFKGSASTPLYKIKDHVDNSGVYFNAGALNWVDTPGNAGTYTYHYKVDQIQSINSQTTKVAANVITMTLTELAPNP